MLSIFSYLQIVLKLKTRYNLMAYSRYKVFMLFISIVILILIGWYANPARLIEILSRSDMLLILAAFVLSNITMILRVYRWDILLKHAKFRELFPIQMIGLAVGNFTPGKISDPIKSFILKPLKGITVAKTLPSIIWERIFDIISLILLSIIALQLITATFDMFLLSMLCVGIFFVVIVLLILTLYKKSFGMRILGVVGRFKNLDKIGKRFIHAFYKQKIAREKLFVSFVVTLITWVLEGVMLYLILLAMGVNVDILLLIGIISLSFTIGIASTLPGGLGSTEVVMALLLGLIGIPEGIAIAAVLVSRLISFWYASFLGAVSFLHIGRKINIKKMF